MIPIQNAQKIFNRQHKNLLEITVHAPGHVNIIGEHTDYNDGLLCLVRLIFGTAVSGTKRDDHIWNVYAADLMKLMNFLSMLKFLRVNTNGLIMCVGWYVLSKFVTPLSTRCKNLVISGNVPLSSGLSSSAALEVAVGKFCQQLGDLPLSHTDIGY